MTYAEKLERSVKDMLISGPSPIKLHALAMITQGKINDELDSSYLEAFEKCIEEESIPIKLTIAKILSKNYVADLPSVDPKTIEILLILSNDENVLVSQTAITEGLMKINSKTKEIKDRISEYNLKN
tara:strand:- start:106 stop:486 length:381 start_codon:yes stop_codon:yes gene_type:complete